MIDDKEFALQWRMDLLAQAQALSTQRAAILSTVRMIEKKYDIEPKKGNGDNHGRKQSITKSIKS